MLLINKNTATTKVESYSYVIVLERKVIHPRQTLMIITLENESKISTRSTLKGFHVAPKGIKTCPNFQKIAPGPPPPPPFTDKSFGP